VAASVGPIASGRRALASASSRAAGTSSASVSSSRG
jgi:hypothetical protein